MRRFPLGVKEVEMALLLPRGISRAWVQSGVGHGWPQSLGVRMGQSSNRFGMHPQTDRMIGLFSCSKYYRVSTTTLVSCKNCDGDADIRQVLM
jgi:hypothetical protein